MPRVLLIAGPGGAGKTTTAERIARHPNWAHVSEDDYWVRVKAGRPAGELRTTEEQELVWAQVLKDIEPLLAAGRNVVLEFILYETPPRPLLAYQGALAMRGVATETRILRPGLDEVLRRMVGRGRPMDAELARLRPIVERQLACLAPPHIFPGWIVDTTGLSLDETYDRYFCHLVEAD